MGEDDPRFDERGPQWTSSCRHGRLGASARFFWTGGSNPV